MLQLSLIYQVLFTINTDHPFNHPMSETPKSGKSIRIITPILTRAVKLWLRSQVSSIGDLEIAINTSDRQLLAGMIPGISIIANQAIYQGIHVKEIKLTATNIKTNLSGVIRGQALKLLEPIFVIGDALISEEGLNASLMSGILSPALTEVLVKFLPEDYSNSKSFKYKSIELGMQRLIIRTTHDPDAAAIPLEFHLGLVLVGQNTLKLQQIQIFRAGQIIVNDESGDTMNLGSDVELNELTIQPGKVSCQGTIKVNP